MLKYSLKFGENKDDFEFVDNLIKKTKSYDVNGTIVYENGIPYLKDNYIAKAGDIKQIIIEAEQAAMTLPNRWDDLPEGMRHMVSYRMDENGKKIVTGERLGYAEELRIAKLMRFRHMFMRKYRKHCSDELEKYNTNTNYQRIAANGNTTLENSFELVKEISLIVTNIYNSYKLKARLRNKEALDLECNDSFTPSIAIVNEATVYERNHGYSCISRKHKTTDHYIVFMVSTKNGITAVKAFGTYCENCNKYFISSSELNKVQLHGVLLCKFLKAEGGYYTGNNILNFDGFGESVLHSMGYNVNATNRLYQTQRWAILEQAINNRILSQYEIINFLEMLIRQREGRFEMLDAINKWKTDIEHVKNFRPSNPRVIATILVKKDND